MKFDRAVGAEANFEVKVHWAQKKEEASPLPS